MRERRLDPTTGEWTTFAPLGNGASDAGKCGLCGATEAALEKGARRDGAIVVLDEELPALAPAPPAPETPTTELYAVEPARGAAELVVYAGRHGATLAALDREHVARLIEVWADRYAELGRRDEVAYVFIFEERDGSADGALAHPHGHVHGYPQIPPRVRRELEVAVAHLAARGTCVFCDVVAHERAEGVRMVAENRSFLAFVPFAARFPYEVHVVAHRHATSLLDLTDPERYALAELLVAVVRGYLGLFGDALGYVMGVHQAPTDDGHWLPISHVHIEFVPSRSSTGELEHAGAELGVGAFVNATIPEQAAGELREALERGEAQ